MRAAGLSLHAIAMVLAYCLGAYLEPKPVFTFRRYTLSSLPLSRELSRNCLWWALCL